MYDPFELPVLYKGEELHFPTQLVQAGYVHRFVVDVYGVEVYFEQDEEQCYRALIDPEKLASHKELEVALLQAIAQAIEVALK